MRKLVSMVIFTLVLGTVVMGQERMKHEGPKMSPEERAEHMANKLSEELSLSDTQRESIKAINLKYTPELKTLKEKELSHEEKRKEMKPIREAMAAEYKTVLTAEQWAMFKEKKKEHHEHWRGHHKGHGCEHERKCEPKDCEHKKTTE